MKTKRVVVSVVVGVLVAALVVGGFFHWENRRIHNVFDEMYVSVVMGTRNWNVFHEAGVRFNYPEYTDARFGFVKAINGLAHDPDNKDFFWGGYDKGVLKDTERITLFIELEEQTLSIAASHEIENTQCLYFEYEYSFKEKTIEIKPLTIFTYDYYELNVEMAIDDGQQVSAFLHEHNISRESIERYRDYFLYDKLLTDWITGNSKHTKFAVNNYGDFKLIDNTFANLGQDWA